MLYKIIIYFFILKEASSKYTLFVLCFKRSGYLIFYTIITNETRKLNLYFRCSKLRVGFLTKLS